ncbi:transposase family protein [Catellatospora sp. NPDC049609]|uniref:transposase family protein n=1 Tax=Catellatospora sp. NPDC049609 TaxID=3155505 RepID=UPI003412B3A6
MLRRWARRVFSHPVFTGISRHLLRLVVGEVGPAWVAGREGRLHERRGGRCRRAAGTGRPLELRLGDRVVITLVHRRTGLSHDALAVAFSVDRSTVTRRSGRSGRCWPGAGLPPRPGCGCGPWPTCSPTPRPRV